MTLYLDNAATSFPKPNSVYEKTIEAMREYGANPGRSGHQLSLRMDREIYAAREALTSLLGGDDPLNTVMTSNCTDALNMTIKGSLTRGGHVITTAMEHNSVLRPLFALKQAGRISLTVVPADCQGYVRVEDVVSAVTKDTVLCVTTAVSNLTGTIMPYLQIGEWMRKKKIRYIVDGAQAVGYLPFDFKNMPIDILCFPGHKSLFGPMGTGGFMFQEGVELDTLIEGGTGSFSTEPNQPRISPDKFESGTHNGPAIIGLGEGCRYIQNYGLERIKAHEDALKSHFITQLADIASVQVYGPKDARQAPVVALNIDGMESSYLAHALDEKYGIATRAGMHCAPLAHQAIGTAERGAVRFSFGLFNTIEEVDRAVDAIKSLAQER